MFGFTLNHTITSQSLGVRVAAPVEIPVATRDVEDIEVTGRAGTLTRLLGWKDTELSLQLAVRTTTGMDEYRKAALALMEATSIAFTGEPGVYRRVKRAEVQPLRRDMSGWGFFDADFVLEPFSYLSIGRTKTTLSTSGTITNPGLLVAEPVITITGTGTLALTVNGMVHLAKAPSGQVTLDSARLVAHVAGKVQTDALTGAFAVLKPGVNQISLGVGISRVDIVPNWRNP